MYSYYNVVEQFVPLNYVRNASKIQTQTRGDSIRNIQETDENQIINRIHQQQRREVEDPNS